MKFPLSWLKEYLDTTASLDEIVDKLTTIGLEVDSVSDPAKAMRNFVAARVIKADKHPAADRLQICLIDIGNAAENVEVVCGAPNARPGMVGVFAGVGAYIPGIDTTLKKSKIRGVTSNGMLLSERELGLSDEHQGIIELPEDTEPGQPAAEVMGLDDAVIDIEITPNRGDCLGVRGIARDLAAAGLGTLRPLKLEPVTGTFDSPISVSLDFAADRRDACPYFVGRYVRGITNRESPKWLKDRLLAVGLRPISALVDITNYMTIGLCRPLHVFDADKIKGNLHLRMARSGETLAALDGKQYQLDDEMTVIADEAAAQALGGVIGGEHSGCDGDTLNVFIESALFDPLRTAATGRALNLISDARFRFERGIDPDFLEGGIEIASRMVIELCGGEASRPVIVGGKPECNHKIKFRSSRVFGLAGVEVVEADQKRILKNLGFTVSGGGDEMVLTAPSWRNDIVGEADIVEEIVRINGFDRIPSLPLERLSTLPRPALSPIQRRPATARRILADRGMVEAVSLSFMSAKVAELFGGISPSVRLLNPISSELDVMRPSILPNLIEASGRNNDRGIVDGDLFEVGPRYVGNRMKDQETVAAGVRTGAAVPRHWASTTRLVDVFDAKADAMAVLARLGMATDKLKTVVDKAPSYYHPGRSGCFCLGPKNIIAWFGEIHPLVLSEMDVKGPIAGFEVFIDRLPRRKARKSAARPHLKLSPLHPLSRDFAFVVDHGVAAGTVLKAARDADRELITEAFVFDVFVGGDIGEAKKSLAISVTLQPRERTLTETEIEAVSERVVEAVKKATGGILRKLKSE